MSIGGDDEWKSRASDRQSTALGLWTVKTDERGRVELEDRAPVNLLVEHLEADRRAALRVPDQQFKPLIAEGLGRGDERAIARPQRNLKQQPARVRRPLSDQVKLVGAHPSGVPRGDLPTGEHLKREPLRSKDLAEPVNPSDQLAEPDLARVRRAHDPPGSVGDRETRERDRFALIARAIVDARQEMEMKLGAHPLFTTRRVDKSFGRMSPDNGMTTRT